jgi:hypothetical protein
VASPNYVFRQPRLGTGKNPCQSNDIEGIVDGRESHIEIFDLCRPLGRELVFDASEHQIAIATAKATATLPLAPPPHRHRRRLLKRDRRRPPQIGGACLASPEVLYIQLLFAIFQIGKGRLAICRRH